VWLEVNLEAVAKNFLRIKRSVKPAKVLAALKANAYGIGTEAIARKLVDLGLDRIGVAEVKEAIEFKKKFNVPVQILSGLLPNEIADCVKWGVVCPIGDYRIAALLSKEAVKQKKPVKVQFKIDTGMGRLGIPYFEARKVINNAVALPGLEVEGILSHFSNANNPTHGKNREQLDNFMALLDELKSDGVSFPIVHIANSDAINNLPLTYSEPFNMVRTGINLYGVFDLEGSKSYKLWPSLELKTRLLSKRKLPAGYTIGYGCTHALFRETWVGTVPAGYADGIPLAASNSGRVLIKGKFCPIIGRVSMDYITVDLSNCPEAKAGDLVTIVGKSGRKQISIEDWAKIKQTHPYDIICSLGSRVARVYL